jgi:hypothetical protein
MPASAQSDDRLWNPANIHPIPRSLTSAAGLLSFRVLHSPERRSLFYLQEQFAGLPYQLSKACPFRNSFASIATMLKRVLIVSRRARS